MLEFQSIDALWPFIIERLKLKEECSSRNGPMKEILGYKAILKDVDKNFLTNPVRKLSASYACAELLWYLSGDPSTTMMQAYAPSYVNFTESDGAYAGEAFGAYGARWKTDFSFRHHSVVVSRPEENQLYQAMRVLEKTPNSRQCVISMWNGGDICHAFAGDKKDLPCTLSLQFLQRNGLLHCVVTMRSNDIWLGFPYDVFCFSSIQRMFAWALGIEAGEYIHTAGSMHLYTKNDKVAMNWTSMGHGYERPEIDISVLQREIAQAVALEQGFRDKGHCRSDFEEVDSLTCPILRDAVLMCCNKLYPGSVDKSMVTSKIFQEMV